MEKTIYLKNDDVIKLADVVAIEMDDGFFMLYDSSGQVAAAVAAELVDYII
jgi:hypothetical protein